MTHGLFDDSTAHEIREDKELPEWEKRLKARLKLEDEVYGDEPQPHTVNEFVGHSKARRDIY